MIKLIAFGNTWKIVLALNLFLVAEQSSSAADISLTTKPNEDCHIQIIGDIQTGDVAKLDSITNSEQFYKVIRQAYVPVICLDSEGGDYSEAMKLAVLVKERRISTLLKPNTKCYSGCALVFMSGSWRGSDFHSPYRRMHVTAKLGFHAPFLIENAFGNLEVNAKDVVDAYKGAIAAIQIWIDTFVRFEHARWTYQRQMWMKPSLVNLALGRNSNNFFFIDTYGKVGNYGIQIFGEEKFVYNKKEKVSNVCANLHFWETDRYKYDGTEIYFFAPSEEHLDEHEHQILALLPNSKYDKNHTIDDLIFTEIWDGGSGGVKCIVTFNNELAPRGCNVWLLDGNYGSPKNFCPQHWMFGPMNRRLTP